MSLAKPDSHLTGRVEIDDSHLVRQRIGGKTGHASENKAPLVAALQTSEDGRPHLV